MQGAAAATGKPAYSRVGAEILPDGAICGV